MYHHIRDYNDPADQTGTNLSVSPAKFASQLDLITQKGFSPITFKDIELGSLPEKPVILTFDDGYENFYNNAFPEIKKRGMKAVLFVISGYDSKEYMSTIQIKEVSENSIEIGSHTVSHPNLTTIPGNKAQEELKKSKDLLEAIVGEPILSFCYPAGKFNEEVKAMVKGSGYKYSVTTKPGKANFSDPLVLARHRISNETSVSAYLK